MGIKAAIYAGTFDPITFGHMDVIRRGLVLADRLVIGVASDTNKTPIFSLEQRVDIVKQEIVELQDQGADIEVYGFEGLVVNFAKDHNANVLIRGLRAVSDFEYEFQMSGVNSKINPEVQTIFIPATENTHFISSRFVKEVARLGGDISELVSGNVKKHLYDIYKID